MERRVAPFRLAAEYADTVTASTRRALEETARRSTIQQRHNEEHGISLRRVGKKGKPGASDKR